MKKQTAEAFGRPGIAPRWTHGNKDGVGTAYDASNRIWFTVWSGIITEVYYPTVDRPQLRDLQYLITDGKTFFHEEKRDLKSNTQRVSDHALGYRCTNSDPDGRYVITKEVITDSHLPCLLQRTRITGEASLLSQLKIYALCAPHLEVGGWGNNAYTTRANGRTILMAHKKGRWLALAATLPFSRVSCGYVGESDGWTDLHEDFQMDRVFDRASDGNVALTGELELGENREFTLGLAFGESEHHAIATLCLSLGTSFAEHQKRYKDGWDRAAENLKPLDKFSYDHGNLYQSSHSLLLAHEDKSYPGALIASLAIPWGEAKGDYDQGGYHLVWTRDMVNSATALLASGNTVVPLRALIYLAVSQHRDGGFSQNFWVDGEPYWKGVQLDEVAFPILLAWKLKRANALQDFDPYHMILKAAAYLVRNGPVTPQERWEEASGYSPSTLASNIAALICAASFLRERQDREAAEFLEGYADFLESHLEAWTVTDQGSLLPGFTRHYIRILPENLDNPSPPEDPNSAILQIANLPAGKQNSFPAKEVVDAGFLELVRYGIRSPDDPVIVDSLKVVDSLLKVDTPAGPVWRRYNHDGYGQQENGGPFTSVGQGRAWPLLTGERAHYELAAGKSVEELIRTMERLASSTGLLPEQVWDEPDLPQSFMFFGKPTGSAMPLMWAHAEYVKLLRSKCDGRVFDFIPDVANRYLGDRKTCKPLEVWKPNRQVTRMKRGCALRIQGASAFRLRWSDDEWQSFEDTNSSSCTLAIDFVDLPIPRTAGSIRFTFFWIATNQWEGKDYVVHVD